MANIKDFATSLIATAPSPANSGTSLVLDAGMGARMPATPFAATIHPEGEIPTLDNAEKVNVTNVAVDTLTIQRAQGQTTAKNIGIGWRISNAIFASDLDLSTYQLKPVEGAFVNGDKTKLDGIESGAQVNTVTSVSGKTGAVTLDKTDVGLSNVDNTSDADKPVSIAQQTALDTKANSSDTVNLTGDQTVAGVKTFSSSPVVPTATATTHAVNKAQMDAADALKVSKAGDTMTGTISNTFAGLPYRHQRPSAGDWSMGSSSGSNYVVWNNTTNNAPFEVSSTAGAGSLIVTATGLRIGASAYYLYGTGFPDGVVSAPVGSIYIDTAITNGASSWIKKSGTGNTGWQVLEGDTGERNVASSWMTANVELGTGFLKFRRIGKTTRLWGRVQLTGAGATGARNSNKPIVDMSTFTDTLPNWNFFMTSIVASIYSGRIATINNSRIFDAVALSGGVSVGNWTIGDQIAFNVTWEEVSAWPTTLPGTAF